jgi:hypothetical protein
MRSVENDSLPFFVYDSRATHEKQAHFGSGNHYDLAERINVF